MSSKTLSKQEARDVHQRVLCHGPAQKTFGQTIMREVSFYAFVTRFFNLHVIAVFVRRPGRGVTNRSGLEREN